MKSNVLHQKVQKRHVIREKGNFRDPEDAFCESTFFRVSIYVMIFMEVRYMDHKTILRNLFSRYASQGAKEASLRGCYEHPVPNALKKATLEKMHNVRTTQNS